MNHPPIGENSELAAAISADYHGKTPHLVGVLKGAWIFTADLIRKMTVPCTVDFLSIQSYGSGTTAQRRAK
jgi:hypoxanthine phosphoribosyltransferase